MQMKPNIVCQELFNRVLYGHCPDWHRLESAEDHDCEWQALSTQAFGAISRAAREVRSRNSKEDWHPAEYWCYRAAVMPHRIVLHLKNGDQVKVDRAPTRSSAAYVGVTPGDSTMAPHRYACMAASC